MSLSTTLTERAAVFLDNTTNRRGFLNRVAMTGSAVAAAGVTYTTRPTSAYAAVCGCNGRTCNCTDLCCDGYTEFCCQIYGNNSCPPDTILAGWWKVDNSSYCAGAARYYMDCNKTSPGCGCGATGVCRGGTPCQCRSCGNRKDGCTVFRYGNCNNHVSCVGPIMCRVVTCSKPWEIDPGCSTVARTDENTRWHHRCCLDTPNSTEYAFVEALYHDFLGRPSDPGGLEFHAKRMPCLRSAGAQGRGEVAWSFGFSTEYLNQVVIDLYQLAFERGPDSGGRRSWVSALKSGMLPSTLAIGLLASAEFYQRSGSTNEGFVRRLYERVLDRPASTGDVTFWADKLSSGTSRRFLAEHFYQSRESRLRRVAFLYQRFLGRDPDPGGASGWASVLLTKADVVLAINISQSQEYLNRARSRFG